jgi:hypothetical protein
VRLSRIVPAPDRYTKDRDRHRRSRALKREERSRLEHQLVLARIRRIPVKDPE